MQTQKDQLNGVICQQEHKINSRQHFFSKSAQKRTGIVKTLKLYLKSFELHKKGDGV